MMKKNYIRIISLLILVFAAFSFVGCSSGNQDLFDKIADLENRISELGNESGGNSNGNYQDLLDKMNELKNKITSQEQELSSLKASVTALQTAKATLEAQLVALETDNTTNKGQIADLLLRVEALEGASMLYSQRLDALETDSSTIQSDLQQLTQDLNNFTVSLTNATKIERIEITPEDIANGNEIIGATSAMILNPGEKVQIVADISFYKNLHYQLVCLYVTLDMNTEEKDFRLYTDKGSANTSNGTLSSTLTTDLVFEANYSIPNKKPTKIVLYRFS